MQKRHKDRKRYFNEQVYTTRKYIIPYLQNFKSLDNLSVLEIGCGEGGNLLPFLELGCKVVGVDLAKDKIANGKLYLSDYIDNNQCILLDNDVFDITLPGEFDLIYFRDVLEHVTDHNKLISFTYSHLKQDGLAFIAFPAWHNPFGGHQQMLNSPLSKVPYLHLLPQFIYKGLLRLTNERQSVIEELLDLKKSRVTVEHFQDIVNSNNFAKLDLRLYLINPNYEVKFNFKPILLNKFFAGLPYIRNFYTTTCYAVLKK